MGSSCTRGWLGRPASSPPRATPPTSRGGVLKAKPAGGDRHNVENIIAILIVVDFSHSDQGLANKLGEAV